MTNILSAASAASILRVAADDPALLVILPMVDAYIINATGYDWTADAEINEVARAAAMMLVVQWYENPAQQGTVNPLQFGLLNVLTQLEAGALRSSAFTVYGVSGAGGILAAGVRVGDVVTKVTGIFGETGDQSAKFESVISVNDYIQQTSALDNSAAKFVIVIRRGDALDP